MNELMKINQVAKKYNISKRTIRYYEEAGMLKSIRKGASQSRFFDNEAVNRLEQILLLRSVQFSVNEIEKILLSDDVDTACQMFAKRMSELDAKANEINYCRDVIDSFIRISKHCGFQNVNIYQLLKDQIYIHSKNERMRKMENRYTGDIIKLEFGSGIIPLADIKQNGQMIDNIKSLRKRLEDERKKEIPLIRVMDNLKLGEQQYIIKIKDITVFNGFLKSPVKSEQLNEIIRRLEQVISDNMDNVSI